MIRTFLAAGIISLMMVGCKQPEEKKPLSDETISIRSTPVKYGSYIIPVRSTGLLVSRREMKLSFKTGGLIKQINVHEGQSVREGEVLAILDLSEIMAQVTQARIGFEKAGRDLKRAENLYNDSVVTLEQYQNTRSAYEVASAQQQVVEFNLVHSRIMAPSNGKIQKILVETNEMIAPGFPAILFASTENDWVVRVALTDKDIVRLAIGDSASVNMDAFPGRVIRAEVTELGAIADPITGTYEAELLISYSMPQFRTGFIARAEIYPAVTERSLLIPIESLVDADDHSAFVFIVADGKVIKRKIRTGMIINSSVVVLDGLKEGDDVVTEGVSYLREDSEVILVD